MSIRNPDDVERSERTSKHLELDQSICHAMGWQVLPYTHVTQYPGRAEESERFRLVTDDGRTWSAPHREAEKAWSGVPALSSDDRYALQLLNDGIERWGSGWVVGDMEEWEAGGLFRTYFSVGNYDVAAPGLYPFAESIARSWMAAFLQSQEAS